jgi:hypothetical protein
LRKFHGPGRAAGTPLEAAARLLARGTSGVWLRAVSRLGLVCRGSAYGSWLLGLLASGLFCYGLYCLLEARYRDLAPGR